MIKSLNPDFEETVRQKLEQQAFMNFVGLRITEISEGNVAGEVDLGPQHLQHIGFVHGGLIASLADTVAGFAALSLVPAGHHAVTAELKVAYLNPGVGQKLIAKGWVLKQGRMLNFCEAEVYVLNNESAPLLVAKASATMATIRPEALEENKR